MLKKIVILILLLTFVPHAYAASSANVEIHNNVSSNSNSQTTAYTNITVETNGKVTHYESDTPGSIEVKSVNGESSIKVNGREVSPTVTNKQPTSASPTGIQNNNKKKEFFINMLKAKLMFFRNFFSFLR